MALLLKMHIRLLDMRKIKNLLVYHRLNPMLRDKPIHLVKLVSRSE